MISAKNFRSALLCICALVQVVAQASAAETADQPTPAVEEIVVKGERVVTSGNDAPSPVTVRSADDLLSTKPSSVADALKSTPQFLADPAARNTAADARGNPVGNYLDLLYFGPNRTLVLFDGIRLPPTSSNGAVDTTIVPQSLVQRVDVVTAGGASAVYGSDAVTGVVNFVLDREFTGFKFDAQSGTSSYGDNFHWKTGATYGTPLLDGRAHFLLSLEHYDSKGVHEPSNRPEQCCTYITAGTGLSPDNAFRLIPDGRTTFNAFGGAIVGPEPLDDIIFRSNGVPSPLIHGLPTGVSVLEQGGDYGTNYGLDLVAPVKTNQVFSRFEYDLTDDVSGHLQGSYSDGGSNIKYIEIMIGFYPPVDIRSGNPFIPPSIQQTMTEQNIPSIQMVRTNRFGDGYPSWRTETLSTNVYWNAGLEGNVFHDYNWKLDYTYNRSAERVRNPNNVNTAKQAAALDAVVDPATGNIVCAATLTPEGASRFAGCEPLNLFGPTAPTVSAYDYITEPTQYTLAHVFHNVNFSVDGSPFHVPAGPVDVAVSAEYRHLGLKQNVVNGDATKSADCTGLASPYNCGADIGWGLQYMSETLGPARGSVNVKEIAGEFLIPLVHDVPMISALDLNLAGRITDYSTVGTVETWKIGSTWQVNDDLRFRGTISRDIRAPTLIDLFGPQFQTNGQVTDIHTGQTTLTPLASGPNPNLVPEVARTYAVGFVYQPEFIPRFSLAVDYYNIDMNNVIINITGSDVLLQQQCELSNGTSPYCSLLERPLPFSDRTPANHATRILVGPRNAARQWTHGIDVEMNYNFNVASILPSVPGEITARALVSYQPLLRSQIAPEIPYIEYAGIAVAGNAGTTSSGNAGNGFSKVRANFSLSYTNDDFNVEVVERIQSGVHVTDPRLYYDSRPDISTYFYTDLSASYTFDIGERMLTSFLSVQNLFNKRPPIIGASSLQAGVIPTPFGYDVIGTYITIGVRRAF